MSDDTTTWLKKNPAINPLRRSLKASLRFHIPPPDLNTSIMSNPDKAKDQGLFIPRMLQRSAMQMRKSRASEFKVPEMVMKPPGKKASGGIEAKQKKVPTPNRMRKSLLPVTKTKRQVPEKLPMKSSLPRPSFFPGDSARRLTAKRELIKKAAELSALKRKEEEESQAKAIVVEESAVLRSILKKRASLRRASQIAASKPKAKKVLFDGFRDSEGEKENHFTPSDPQNDFNTALDEPTVFLNFPNGITLESPFEAPQPPSPTAPHPDIAAVATLWQSYKEDLKAIQTELSSLEESLQSLMQLSVNFQKEYEAYRETSKGMLARLSRLEAVGTEMEASLKRAMEGRWVGAAEVGVKVRRRSVEGRGSDKIKMSQKSKTIRKSSGRKSVPVLKNLLRDLEDSFSVTRDC